MKERAEKKQAPIIAERPKRTIVKENEQRNGAKKKRIEEKKQATIVAERPTKTIQFRRQIKKMPKVSSNALMPKLHKHELVWAYMKGYPSWPGVIEDITSKGKYLIHFFGDYSKAEVTRRFIINYFEGFNQFSCNFGNIKLKKAVEEATYFLLGNPNSNECFVCQMLQYKKDFLRSCNSSNK